MLSLEEAYVNGQLYSVDEAGFYVGDHPRKGRAKRGKRLAVGTSKTLRRTKFSLVMVVGRNGPSVTSTSKEDYKQLFLTLVAQHEQTSFQSTFENTLAFLRETRESIDTYPNFKFIGYDLPAFIRLNSLTT